MPNKMLSYVDSSISYTIKLVLQFDDDTTQEGIYSVGQEINIDYIKERKIETIHGVLKKISLYNNTILTIDGSTEYNTRVENVSIDNIRRLNNITPSTIVKGTIEHDGLTGPVPMIVENIAIFTGEIQYLAENVIIGSPTGNIVGVKITAPNEVLDLSELKIDGVSAIIGTDKRYFIKYFNVTETDQVFKINVQWDPYTVEETYTIIIADAIF